MSSVLHDRLGGFFVGKSKLTSQSLQHWRIILAIATTMQALAIIVLSVQYRVPIVASFLTTDTLQSQLQGKQVVSPATAQLLSLNLSYLIVAMFTVTVLTHLAMVTVYRHSYERFLVQKEVNPLRWLEAAVTTSLMLVIIAMLVGVYDAVSLALLCIALVLMSLSVFAFELVSQTKRNKQLQWIIGSIILLAAIVPWLVIASYLVATSIFATLHQPTYLYWLCASIFVVFIIAGFNTYLSHRRQGKWASYLWGDFWHVAIIFVAESLLAWQVFASVLHP